jgi:nitrate reductase gamma subunit
MSTAHPTDFELERAQLDRRKSLRLLIVLPALFGAFLLAEPEFSAGWALFVAAATALAVAALVAFELRDGYRSRVATELYATLQLDLMCLFATILAWRVTRTPAWVLVVFVGMLVVLGTAAYVFRRAVLSELVAPRTAAGKLLLLLLASTTALGGGALGYVFGRTAGGWAVAVVMLGIAYWLALLRQAWWLKVEQPDWRPVR